MKKVLLLCFAMLAMLACGEKQSKAQEEETRYAKSEDVVYVCMGGSSQRYHATDECRGLCRCKSEIKAISIEKAERMGRTPCQICY